MFIRESGERAERRIVGCGHLRKTRRRHDLSIFLNQTIRSASRLTVDLWGAKRANYTTRASDLLV